MTLGGSVSLKDETDWTTCEVEVNVEEDKCCCEEAEAKNIVELSAH